MCASTYTSLSLVTNNRYSTETMYERYVQQHHMRTNNATHVVSFQQVRESHEVVHFENVLNKLFFGIQIKLLLYKVAEIKTST